MDVVVEVLWFALGVALIGSVLDSAVRTFVLPRGSRRCSPAPCSWALRTCFNAMARLARTYDGRDAVMALYGPVGLLVLPFVWIVVTLVAFAAIFHTLGVSGYERAIEMSGSSLFTLGFVRPPDFAATCFAFLEAALGLGLLALLIAYLPTIYAAFSRRGDHGRTAGHLRWTPAVGRGDPGAHPPHGTVAPARRRVGAVAGLVRGDRGDPHLARGRELLPLTDAPPVVDHRRGRGARRRVAAPRRGRRRGFDPQAGAPRAFGSLRAQRGRRLLRPAARSRSPPTDPILVAREEFEEACRPRWWPAGWRCGPTATRRGPTSRAGG